MTITQLNKRAIAVTGLPEGAYDFEVKQMGSMFDYHYILTYKTPFRWDKYGKRNYDWNTRSEKPMSILGPVAELTEEQKAEYAPLLKSSGLYLVNPLGSHPSTWEYIDIAMHKLPDDIKTWDKFQLLTNPLILINDEKL